MRLTPAFRRRWVVLFLLSIVLAPARTAAQEPAGSVSHIRWWHGLVALGGYALLVQVDDGIQRFVQDNRSDTGDDIARVSRQFGQPEVYVTIGVGVFAAGLVLENPAVRKAGIRINSSLAMAGVVVTAAKALAGRSRPSHEGSDAEDFNPFSGNTSAPSGHAAMAFALATSLGEEIHNRWASAGLYTVAAATAWSRVNDNVHWFSDVAAGAVVGIVAAKFMNGKVTIFGVHPPHLRLTPSGAGLAWSGAF
jgi:membrane-associated phospholipid phosphatase